MVIEDQPELGRVIRDVLASEGLEAVPVPDVPGALAALEERPVEFLVSDLPSDPRGSDEDPILQIAQRFPELPILVIRDPRSNDVPFFGPWRREGTRIHLRRPFRIDDLVAASQEILASRAS